MGYSFVGGEDPGQQFLLPPDARDWLPADHLAWRLLSVAAELDLAPFLAGYRSDGRSRPAYHPRLMLGLVMYCYCKGIRSSRAIELACWDDVGARVIMGNRQPDHATIARFVTVHREAIKNLLVQTLVICARDGLLRVDVVAGDGTVVRANASKAHNATAEQLGVQIGELQAALDAEVESWFAQAAAEDAAEDALVDPDLGPDDPDRGEGGRPAGGPGTLAHTVGRLLRRRQAKDRLDTREAQRRQEIIAQRQAKADNWAARVAAREQFLTRVRATQQAKADAWHARDRAAPGGLSGARPGAVDEVITVRRAAQALENIQARHAEALAAVAAPIPAPDTPPVANTTDPASRIIPGKNGHGRLQAYNVQVIAATRQIILHIGTHDSSTDTQALHPGLRAARANLDAAGIPTPIGAALFDAGYASDTNFTTGCPDPQTLLYVAVDKEARQTGRLADGNTRNHRLASWQQMAHRLTSEEGQALYRQRAAIVEPVFAQLFNRLGRHLHHRGRGVDTELHLWASSHNLLKIMKNRIAHPAAAAPA